MKEQKMEMQHHQKNNDSSNSNNDDELKNVGLVIGIISITLFSSLIIPTFLEDETDINDQRMLFYISFVCIFYNLIISIFSINLFKEYLCIIKSIFARNFNYKDSLNQLIIANTINFIISMFILGFVVDWSLWGGYMFKVGTTLSIFFIFTIVEIVKFALKSKSKK